MGSDDYEDYESYEDLHDGMSKEDYEDLQADWEHECKKDTRMYNEVFYAREIKLSRRLAKAGNRCYKAARVARLYDLPGLYAQYIRKAEAWHRKALRLEPAW